MERTIRASGFAEVTQYRLESAVRDPVDANSVLGCRPRLYDGVSGEEWPMTNYS